MQNLSLKKDANLCFESYGLWLNQKNIAFHSCYLLHPWFVIGDQK